jgi:hypothetical protein
VAYPRVIILFLEVAILKPISRVNVASLIEELRRPANFAAKDVPLFFL